MRERHALVTRREDDGWSPLEDGEGTVGISLVCHRGGSLSSSVSRVILLRRRRLDLGWWFPLLCLPSRIFHSRLHLRRLENISSFSVTH
ncbi:hypothetical protein F2Q68_00003971 [Brassica cretica]|uniref:Uncharacterized protein n=2 Tax=Brassica cretica TaxID=69181 RepID=A0A8S9JLM0_BRACR|nr:hypothetical protein F2Q68_00003971 [Brassica cretica]KAF3549541.1 hypothetical protein DY000_02005854 [Brassica cretica]